MVTRKEELGKTQIKVEMATKDDLGWGAKQGNKVQEDITERTEKIAMATWKKGEEEGDKTDEETV